VAWFEVDEFDGGGVGCAGELQASGGAVNMSCGHFAQERELAVALLAKVLNDLHVSQTGEASDTHDAAGLVDLLLHRCG